MKKKAYWFLFGFVVWCVASALWYLYDIKGVLSGPDHFNAANRLVAIIEILFMLLGACLFGFGIAWWMRAEVISAAESSLDQLQSENENLIATKGEMNSQFQTYKSRASSEASALKMKIAEANRELEVSKSKLEEEEGLIQKLKIERAEKNKLLEEKSLEKEKLASQISQLESIRKKLEQANHELESEVKQLQALREEQSHVSNHPFVKPIQNEYKDDLTKIKGIGPFIEKRLNMLGIYNFQQLSELEPEMVERVGAAIEFFPDRILRENWIGQAKRFAGK